LDEVRVLSALDEPLFKRFGSDKIIQMMKQMGMSEKQSIEHDMISKAIQNAQDKIDHKIDIEQSARSQNDWLVRNLPS
jgi:preprotein translocase subunit SecA